MVEVVDEVLTGEPLYRAIDKDGNIVLDNIRLEMITPVTQAGTPLNKVLFDSIKTDIQKTNTTIDELEKFSVANVLADSITAEKNILNISSELDLNVKNRQINFIVEDIVAEYVGDVIPVLTSSNLKGFQTTKIVYDGKDAETENRSFYKLCDGDDSTLESSGDFYAKYIIKTPFLVKPQKVKLVYKWFDSTRLDIPAVIEASNDEGKTWTKLCDVPNTTNTVKTLNQNISTDVFYNMFRVTAPSYSSTNPALVYTFQVTSKERSAFDSSKESQINGLNISKKIGLNKYYKGMYDGSKIIIYTEF